MKYVAKKILSLFIVCLWFSCDSVFEPLDNSRNYNFSMYGTLNVHADTQWVRVMPVAKTLISNASTPHGTVVTLTRLSTGETYIMNDSLYTFSFGQVVAWNYWTKERIYPNEVYRLEATGIHGEKSFVTVETPPELTPPLVQYSVTSESGTVSGTSNDSLVQASIRYTVERGITEIVDVSLLSIVDYENNGAYNFSISNGKANIRSILGLSGNDFSITERELIVAIGNNSWPDLTNMTEEEIYFPEAVKNVEQGVGYVAGIALLRMPLKSCYDTDDNQIPCEPL